MLKFTSTDKAPAAIGPYSQAVAVNGFLFTSGQVALMPGTGEIAGTTIEEQAERVMQNLKAILEENGVGFENVVKTTCFIADMNDFAAFNEIYGKYFTSKPARSCVAVKQLPKNLLCEVEVIAVLDK
ncbi:RidA family protein [Anaerotignum faecicola]|nr:RidA family protein [Anaerotignum faecicola]